MIRISSEKFQEVGQLGPNFQTFSAPIAYFSRGERIYSILRNNRKPHLGPPPRDRPYHSRFFHILAGFTHSMVKLFCVRKSSSSWFQNFQTQNKFSVWAFFLRDVVFFSTQNHCRSFKFGQREHNSLDNKKGSLIKWII